MLTHDTELVHLKIKHEEAGYDTQFTKWNCAPKYWSEVMKEHTKLQDSDNRTAQDIFAERNAIAGLVISIEKQKKRKKKVLRAPHLDGGW